MEESKQQVEREIKEAQAQLAETLEALGEKVAPQQIVGKAKEKARDKLDELSEKVSPPRVARRQVEKVKDKLRGDSDDDDTGSGDDDVRERLAEAARQIDEDERGQ